MTDRIRKSKSGFNGFLDKKSGTRVKVRRKLGRPSHTVFGSTMTWAMNAFLLRLCNFHILPEMYAARVVQRSSGIFYLRHVLVAFLNRDAHPR